jgi:competence protein ComEC
LCLEHCKRQKERFSTEENRTTRNFAVVGVAGLCFHRGMKPFFAALAISSISVFAGQSDGRLDVIWSDVEGGAGTLIVTPSGESVLIDSGNPGGRDSGRIHKAATEAGLKRIDHLITTHLHIDHFGGAGELSKLIPIGTVWDNGVPDTDPDGRTDASWPLKIKAYREMAVEKREVIKPGTQLPLKQRDGAPKMSVRCIGAKQKFIDRADGAATDCPDSKEKEKDTSDNANSIVTLIEFGKFQLFVGGDLTWNIEKNLVCPKNLVGEVDVYQATHHGLDQSNNPLVVKALKPTVTVMSNGTTKGCGAETFATLKSVPSVQAMYQIHRNLRQDSENNTAPEYIANLEKDCQGVPIKMSVAADSSSYTFSIPGKGSKTFQTK